MLAAADLAAALGAMLIMALLEGPPTALWATLLLPVWILMAKSQGLYDRDHARIRHVTIDELSALFYWATLSVAATALVLAALPVGGMSATTALATWSMAVASGFLLRAAARAAWRAMVPLERGMVVGEGHLAEAVRRKLVLERGHHLELVATPLDGAMNGALSSGNGHASPADRLPSAERLEKLIADQRIERVLLAVPDLDEEHLSGVVAACRSRGVKLSVAPPLRAMLGTAVSLDHLAELPLVEFQSWGPARSTMLIKRTVDVVGASLALIVLSPLLALIATVVRIDSRGPVLFRQLRAGRGGVPFEVLKFRTMVPDAESQIDRMVAWDELEEPIFKIMPDDPRVTRVGRVLRRWSLDELPQLVNVLMGSMSLVGPRPEWLRLADRFGEPELFRLEMRPGLTGPMQVHGRGELTHQERLAVEREYVENYSLQKDLEILLRTLTAVIRGHGAF